MDNDEVAIIRGDHLDNAVHELHVHYKEHSVHTSVEALHCHCGPKRAAASSGPVATGSACKSRRRTRCGGRCQGT